MTLARRRADVGDQVEEQDQRERRADRAQDHDRADRAGADLGARDRADPGRRQHHRADRQRDGDRADRVHVGEVALDDEEAGRVAEVAPRIASAPRISLGCAADVDPEQQDHAAEADEQARPGAAPARARVWSTRIATRAVTSGSEAIRIAASDEETSRSPSGISHQGSPHSAIENATSGLGLRAQPVEVAQLPRDRQEQRGADRHAAPRHQHRRGAAVERDLDEEIRNAPDQRDRGEEDPGSAGHRP